MPASLIDMSITLLLILLNGVFSMSETAFVSARRARLQQQADSGDANARAALELMNAPNRFLSTVQIGITLIGILAGAFGGATLSLSLSVYLSRIPWLAPYAETLSFAIIVVLITYLSLVIGELVPKRIALNAPERIAKAVVRPMRLLSLLASPLIAFLSLSTEAVLRLLRVRPSTEPPVTEEEITNLIEEGRMAGVFEETEQDLVERVFRLGDRRASALMIPRIDIIWIDIDDPVDQIHRVIIQSGRTRFPVCQGTLDNVLGIVHVKDLYAQLVSGQPMDLRAILEPTLFVPATTRAFNVLERFKQTGWSMALVVQEYGEIEGMVTLTDVLEALVGELPSADEPVEQEAVQREDGSWLLDGALPVEDLQDLLDIEHLPDQDSRNYETVGGLVMHQLGRIPVATDSFDWAGWRFEVVDMDGRRVDKVLATPLHASQETPAATK
jgi:putative hemolysin